MPLRIFHQKRSLCERVLFRIAALLLAFVPNMEGPMNTQAPIRTAAVAGQFYPESPDVLREEVDALLAAAPKDDRITGDIVAIVAPHAGYIYSGRIAAIAYRQVQGREYDAVVILAPSHREAFAGVSLMPAGGYETPLGIAGIHEGIARKLLEQGGCIHETRKGHGPEHAVEVQIPFIQRALGSVPIVPLVMGEHSWPVCNSVARAIARAVEGMNVLVVASSDLYHGDSEAECETIDRVTLAAAESRPPQQFCADLDAGRAQACGGAPIAVAKEYARLLGASGVRVLAHATSADVTGHRGGYVVGYGAIAYFRNGAAVEQSSLSEEDRALLLRLARESVRAAAAGRPLPQPPKGHPALEEPKGAFVTLHKDGDLRGCIGLLQAYQPLAATVIEMAQAAAINDPRFPPLREHELDTTTLEISILSPFEVTKPEQVEVGTHGIFITGRGRRGVLLPQVATEQGWDRETFLEHVCLKAGLPRNAWQSSDVVLERFSAEIIHDTGPIGREETRRN